MGQRHLLKNSKGIWDLGQSEYTSSYPCMHSDKIGSGNLQDLLEGVGGADASGNPILGDFGKWFTGKVP